MREPNFFLVGAPKAGTTSLYHYLAQHPDIYMSPIKEPCFFSEEARSENFEPALRARGQQIEQDTRDFIAGPMRERRSGGIVRDWVDYLRLFAPARHQRAVGEASVNYLWSRTAASRIAESFPGARILMVLRSPADRAFSQYCHVLTGGHCSQSFRDYVHESLWRAGAGLGVYHPFLEMGLYAAQVERYLQAFPRRHIGIWFYEDATADPPAFLRQVFDFLSVDSRFTPDTSRRYNQPRVTATMTADDRALMLDFYRDDIRRLQDLLNKDLSAWQA